MPSSEISALHSRLFTIDTHTDTATACLMRGGWDFGAKHAVVEDRTQCDLLRMDGAIDAMVFAVYSTQAARVPEGFRMATERALEVIDRVHAVAAQHALRCAVALTAADGPGLKAEGRHALYLSLENSYSLGLDVHNVRRFFDRGVRMIGLTHMLNNDLADSSTDPRGPEWHGLSPFGREVMAACNRLGLVLDASHASDAALWELLRLSKAPVILSHSGCRAVCDHPRNIDDDLLRALAEQDGVIQVNALPIAVVPTVEDGRTRALSEVLLKLGHSILTPEVLAATDAEWHRLDQLYPNPRCTLADYVKHVVHAVKVAGIDHVGIGCDFDGGGGVEGLNEVSDYPNLTAALVAQGFTEPELRKLWGGNTLRLLARVETVAKAG